MRARHVDLLVVVGLALVSAYGVLLLPEGVPRFFCAAYLLLLAPGYGLTAATFPPATAPGPVRLMVGLLLSIATLAVGAVLLNALQVGLGREAWTMLALAVTLGACAVAAIRRGDTSPRLRIALPRVRATEILLLVLAAVAVSAGVAISRTPLPAKEAIGYTQLWMLPTGPGNEVTIGVRSAEQRTYAYRVELVTPDDRRVVRSRIVLAPGERYEQRVQLPGRMSLSGRFATRQIVTVLLYRLDRPTTYYRRVTARLSSR